MFNDFIVSTRIATLQIQSICLRSGVVMELTAGMTPETHEKVRLQHTQVLAFIYKCLRLCAPSEKIYYAQFFFTIKPNPKNETGSK